MKNFKIGFSLAELLLVMGIMGVITALGITITKHAAETAYSRYWYTGYINLYNTIGYFNQKRFFEDVPGVNGGVAKINSADTFAAELRTVFSAAGQETEVVAKNGIRYNIVRQSVGLGNNVLGVGDPVYSITMTVPQPKSRRFPNGSADTVLMYIPQEGALIPTTLGDVSLQDRRDLLPVYYDTGVQNNNRITTQSSRVYSSYNRAYCTNHREDYRIYRSIGRAPRGGEPPAMQEAVIRCVTHAANDVPGVLRFINPAKVK